MSDDLSDRHTARLGAAAVFVVVFGFILVDVVADYGEGASWAHLGLEICVLMLTAAGICMLLWQRDQARRDLSMARQEASQWQAENRDLMRGLGAAIEKQFVRWVLSKSEAEVGLLLLKGLSHKEIGEIRGVSERTVREQARAVYRKSDLSGRSALSAFFLEDLLLPMEESPRDGCRRGMNRVSCPARCSCAALVQSSGCVITPPATETPAPVPA